MEKVQVFLMFYPIDWERHIFDNMTSNEIINFVKERGVEDVRFVEWGDITDWDWSEANYDADLFNDWDDTEDEDVEKECRELCKHLKLDKKMVKGHWCYPVTKNMVDVILKTN